MESYRELPPLSSVCHGGRKRALLKLPNVLETDPCGDEASTSALEGRQRNSPGGRSHAKTNVLVPRQFPKGRVGKGTGPLPTQTQCTLRWPKVIGLLVYTSHSCTRRETEVIM